MTDMTEQVEGVKQS